MAHLFSFLVVQSAKSSVRHSIAECGERRVYLLGEIDFMVQEGGLCRRGRYYRDL